MQNNKNGGRVRLKDIQNMLAKDFNIHYQNINSVHYIRDLCVAFSILNMTKSNKSNSCSWVFFYLG
jgi:hypothetical protein